ncbi:hypothetical protein DPMN_166970 [Dreissena polymorpha]|uniref:Uncharacterized protein n=1 Tax=Dreissena polymorpha TaxID=45954 RepID=A0A9D4IYC7_DREPO|nr:hypothetical protein DPMN_166970 [Dreissena polymorpha]
MSKDGTGTDQVHGDCSDGQAKRVVVNQLPHRGQALQVSLSLHPALRLGILDASRRHRTQYTSI